MNAKIDAPTPQRISVPEGTELQIYARDAKGNKMLMSLPGPVDISMVPIEWRELCVNQALKPVRADCCLSTPVLWPGLLP